MTIEQYRCLLEEALILQDADGYSVHNMRRFFTFNTIVRHFLYHFHNSNIYNVYSVVVENDNVMHIVYSDDNPDPDKKNIILTEKIIQDMIKDKKRLRLLKTRLEWNLEPNPIFL